MKPTLRFYAHVVALIGLFALAACNTAQGFGEDLSVLGNKISNKAEQHTK